MGKLGRFNSRGNPDENIATVREKANHRLPRPSKPFTGNRNEFQTRNTPYAVSAIRAKLVEYERDLQKFFRSSETLATINVLREI